jgi:hypothetical protein
MFRFMKFTLSVVAVCSLLGSGLAFASKGLPNWEVAFDPGPYMSGGNYLIMSVEEYKENLYIVAAGMDEQGGRVFRSPDGKNWEAVTEAGFGLGAVEDECGTNYYDNSWDMAVFKGELYLLPYDQSCYLRPGLIMRTSDGVNWETVVTTKDLGFTIPFEDITFYGQFHKLGVFKGMLYANLDYYDVQAGFNTSIIVRSPNGNPGTWEKVMDFPGWGYPGTFQVFMGALYVASDTVLSPPDEEPAPEQIWRSFDGLNWEMVVGNGFGNPGSDGLGGFADYKGYLYVGAASGEAGGAQIWRSKDGLTWQPVTLEGLLSPTDDKIDGLDVYEGELYAHTVNWTNGSSVFRTKDAISWERVNEPGWGNPDWSASLHTADQVVFKDELYMGVNGFHGVLLKMVHPDK